MPSLTISRTAEPSEDGEGSRPRTAALVELKRRWGRQAIPRAYDYWRRPLPLTGMTRELRLAPSDETLKRWARTAFFPGWPARGPVIDTNRVVLQNVPPLHVAGRPASSVHEFLAGPGWQ